MEQKLLQGQKVFFLNDRLPYIVKAASERYAVCVRKMSKKEDDDLLAFEVTRGSYSNKKEAWDSNKNNPVYTIVDYVAKKRAPDDYIFGLYDYFNESDCKQCIIDLYDDKAHLSKRHGAELNIDWELTNKKNKI